jgi:dipeptidyl aminopeptidase/acylaminoacyl peptidase
MSLFPPRAAALVACLALFESGVAPGQSSAPAPAFALTVDNIMRGPGLVGYEPGEVRWSGDGERVYFRWKQASDPVEKPWDTYVVNRNGSGLRKLTSEEAVLAPPLDGDRTRDRKRVVYAHEGDLYVYDYTTDRGRRITNTSDIESNPHFTRDGAHVYFTRANNLYVLALDDGAIQQMTDIRTAGTPAPQPPPSPFGPPARPRTATSEETKGTESQEALKKEEQELFDVVRRREQVKKEEEERRKKENPRKPFTLQARQSIQSLQLSPDEKYVTATVMERPEGAKNTIVPDYITDSGYTEDIPSREKVGDRQPRIRIAVISVSNGEVKWVDHAQKENPPQGPTRMDSGKETGENVPPKAPQPQEREVQLLQPIWSEDGTKAVLYGRAADNKDRWIFALDPATGKTRVLVDLHDDAWVDGPGARTLGWLKGDHEIYFQSERSGYSHLYAVPWEGGEPRALTSGNWEVRDAELSNDKSRFFITTSEADPGVQRFYEMSADGGPRMLITPEPGKHDVVLSLDERWMADVYSYTNKPPELYVQENRPNARPRKLTSSPAPDFWKYPWLDVPIVTFPARDGAMLRARFFKPASFKKGGPAVIFVHGAGYLQEVHRWWSSYYREYMFDHLLMERGFEVLDIDYRGSAGYGRDWRTAIYRHMGGKDLDDQVDGARWLVSQQGADAKRIGIWGGSYGGFITLMAMFTQPDVFAAGGALRPVSDWAEYNNGYTSNILNLPQTDKEAYRRSSPIYFASGLKGALLICHGMVDTNVHFQDTVRLVQRLIELHKDNWELAVYPVENHEFQQPSSWADEYKRILKLFETRLNPSYANATH